MQYLKHSSEAFTVIEIILLVNAINGQMAPHLEIVYLYIVFTTLFPHLIEVICGHLSG